MRKGKKVQEKKPVAKAYSAGQRFSYKNPKGKMEKYLLCFIGFGEYVLVNMQTGHYWNSPITIKRNKYILAITVNQFKKHVGNENVNKFKPVKK